MNKIMGDFICPICGYPNFTFGEALSIPSLVSEGRGKRLLFATKEATDMATVSILDLVNCSRMYLLVVMVLRIINPEIIAKTAIPIAISSSIDPFEEFFRQRKLRSFSKSFRIEKNNLFLDFV